MMEHSPRRRRRRNGYALIELLGAVLIAIVLVSMFLNGARPVPGTLAAAASRQVRAALAAALADADAEGGDVEVKVDASRAGDLRGRFIAHAGVSGVTSAGQPAASWIEFRDGVSWGPGTASVDPFGVPTDGRVPGTVRCTPDECSTGAADYVVYYVGHIRAPRVGYALVLGRDREIRAFRWDHEASSWRSSPQ